MTYTLPLSEVKIKLSKLVEGIVKKDDEIVITRNGRPVAVILSAEEHEGWKETQAIKSDPALMKEIKKGIRALQKGNFKSYSLDELFGGRSE